MAKKLLQQPDSINLLMVNGGGQTHDYVGIPPIQIEGDNISLDDDTVILIGTINSKLPMSTWNNTTGSFATTSQINDLTNSTSSLYNSLDGIIYNTATLYENVDTLSSNYDNINEAVSMLNNNFNNFTDDVNDYFETNNENIIEMSGNISDLQTTVEGINSFTGVWTDDTLSGDGYNTPLTVVNGLPENLYSMLDALSSLLSTSSDHPNAMIGMTAGNFSWIDLA